LIHIWGSPGEQAITFQIQVNALEEVLQVEQAITTLFQYLEPVIETLHKAAALSMDEVIGNLFPRAFQGIEKVIEAGQSALAHLFHPGPDFSLRLLLGRVLLKDGGQLFAQLIGQFGSG